MEEAVWFMSLPDKVRRGHFTREEQILIRAQCELALLNAPQEVLWTIEAQHASTQYRQSISPTTRRHSSSTAAESLPDLLEDDSDDDGSIPDFDVVDLYTSQSRSCGAVKEAAVLPTPNRFNPHEACLDSPTGSSFSGPTIQRPTSSSALSTPAQPLLHKTRRRSITLPGRRHARLDSTSTADPSPPPTQYLKDPEARSRLRQYLSSPEKFDEALEFGFAKTVTPRRPSQPTLHAHNRPDSLATHNLATTEFLHTSDNDDDASDVEGGDEASDSSASDPDWPITPRIAAQALRFASSSRSSTSTSGSSSSYRTPRAFSGSQGGYQSRNFSVPLELEDRDMTLRLTLTRPELRAAEEEGYGWRGRGAKGSGKEAVPGSNSGVVHGTDVRVSEVQDPLALEELVISDDVTGMYGAFAKVGWERERGIRRLWGRLRRR